MAKTILTVILVMVLVAYAAMFYAANQQTVSLTAWRMGGTYYVEDGLPVGLVVLGSALVGAIIMALALAGAAREAQNRLRERATAKLNELVARVKQQRARIAELETLAEALEKAAAAKPAAPAPVAATAPAPTAAMPPTEPAVTAGNEPAASVVAEDDEDFI